MKAVIYYLNNGAPIMKPYSYFLQFAQTQQVECRKTLSIKQ